MVILRMKIAFQQYIICHIIVWVRESIVLTVSNDDNRSLSTREGMQQWVSAVSAMEVSGCGCGSSLHCLATCLGTRR